MSLKLFFLGAFLLITTSVASALPRFALRGADASCGGCHVDPTGGGMRTEGGDNFAMNRLAMWKRGPKFSANIGESIRIGVDMRSQYLYFNDKFSRGTDSTGVALSDTSVSIHGAQEMTIPIYISAKLSDAVHAYLRYDVVDPKGWQGFADIHFVHSSGDIWQADDVLNDAYLKIGAFLPTFGIRFDDHSIYTRGGNASLSRFGTAGLIWQPNYKDEGAELGLQLFDRLQITADILNGNEQSFASPFKSDPFGKHAYAVRLRYVESVIDNFLTFEVGGSGYFHDVTVNPVTDSSLLTRILAVHGGVRVGPVSVLAEYDLGSNIYHYFQGTSTDTAHALAIEAAFDVTEGLTAIGRYDSYKGNADGELQTQVKSRISVGAQWFPLRFLEFRPELRFASVTVNEGGTMHDHSQVTALIQTHIFF
jgi:hypothetical protein